MLFGDWDDVDTRAELASRTRDGGEHRRPNPMHGQRPGETFVRRAAEVYAQQGYDVTTVFPEDGHKGFADWWLAQEAAA